MGLFLHQVRACCRRASINSIWQYRKHSTARRNQPAHSRKASTCRPECDNASKRTESIHCNAVPQVQHSTAKSARTRPQSKYPYVPIRVRQRKQADKVWPEPARAVQHLHSTLSSQNEPRNRNLSGLHENNTRVYNYSHSVGVMREGFASSFGLSLRHNTALFLRPFHVFCTCIRRPGCYLGAWSSWHLQVVSFAPKILALSVSFIRM